MKTKHKIKFTKAVASGNDFIIIDNKSGKSGVPAGANYSKLAEDLCRRHLSVGADGLLVLEKSKKADFRMRIINPDGSEVTMCGNGARASALYAAGEKWGTKLTFETGAGIIKAEVKGDTVKLRMSDPKDAKLNIALGCGEKITSAHFINSGVPHVVCLVKEIEDFPVKEIGEKIRYHELFSPAGTNANFVNVISPGSARIRTYERGVEDETLACGTGSVASALILGLLGKVSSPVKMRTESGEELAVHYKRDGNKITDVYLEGTAEIVFEGSV